MRSVGFGITQDELKKAKLMIEQNNVNIKIDKKLLFVISIFFKQMTAKERNKLAIKGSREQLEKMFIEGLRMTTTPIKPNIMAIIRFIPITSCKKKTDNIEIKKTEEKLIVCISTKWTCRRDRKNKVIAQIPKAARIRWRG